MPWLARAASGRPASTLSKKRTQKGCGRSESSQRWAGSMPNAATTAVWWEGWTRMCRLQVSLLTGGLLAIADRAAARARARAAGGPRLAAGLDLIPLALRWPVEGVR